MFVHQHCAKKVDLSADPNRLQIGAEIYEKKNGIGLCNEMNKSRSIMNGRTRKFLAGITL